MKQTLEQILKRTQQKPPNLRSSNGHLSLHLGYDEGGYSQRVLSDDGHTLFLDASGGDIALNLGGRELLLKYDQARIMETGKEHARLRAIITRPEFEITTTFQLWKNGAIDVATSFAARTEMPLSSIEHRYIFPPTAGASRSWDFLWLPNLKARRSHLAGQHTFRSPCAIIQKGSVMAALIPALNLIEADMPLPAALDFREPGELRCGLVAHKPTGHLFFERKPREAILLTPGRSVRFGFRMVGADDAPARLGAGPVARMLWQQYGKPYMESLQPQTLTFDDFARYAYDGFFERQGIWRGFELDGQQVGGTSVRLYRSHLAAEGTPPSPAYSRKVMWHYLFSGALKPLDKIHFLLDALRKRSDAHFFGCWFNNLRTAYGLAHYGQKWGDERLTDAARRIRDLILAAPARAGLFPVAYVGTKKRPAWLNGTRAFFLSRDYGVADLCETGIWLLRFYLDIEREPALLQRCQDLAEALLSAQTEDGAFPAWLHVGNGNGRSTPQAAGPQAAGPLAASATTAAAGRFLAALSHITHDPILMDAARRAADFIIDRVWPAGEWFDFETFYSCSTRPLSWRDAESGVPPQSTLAISWAAELLAQVYRSSEEPRYLTYGLATLDLLLLFQQVWNASFLSYHTFGGFGVMNTDGEWSDARQALFVPLLLDYYEITGDAEYFERAVAALRASFVLMHAPENAPAAPGNTPGVTESDYGAMPENYGHAGIDRKIGGYLHPDWGSGSACAAAACVQQHYGDVFMDATRGAAFGINGCRVLSAHVSVRVIDLQIERLPLYDAPAHCTPLPREVARGILIRCVGLTAREMTLWVNNHDLGTHSAQELAAGVIFNPISPQEH
jgi:hypothetical protein